MREAVLSSDYLQKSSAELSEHQKRANCWQFVLIISVSTALLFAAGGLFMSGLAYLGLVEQARILSRVGTILIVVSAPLFILAAHCLDEMRFETKREKREKYFGDSEK